MTIFIPYNTSSSKNSNRWTGKFLIKSKTVMNYIKKTAPYFIINKPLWKTMSRDKTKPFHVEFLFVRDSKRKFDYINAAQIVQDLMVKNGWIDDDNADELVPVFAPYQYDKGKPGVYIKIL